MMFFFYFCFFSIYIFQFEIREKKKCGETVKPRKKKEIMVQIVLKSKTST